eukprot:GHVR01076059.1.p1 GENE.GHVR01076059.1~~GHVR01076059.1.p1  ORF type:complete len:566 (-),score=109.02 GHVR01076059.1:257-1954(-)
MAGYTRQDTANNIANGNVIDADDFDAEYNAIEAGFNASTGHTHDGTAGEGAPITKVGPAQDLIVSGTALTPKTTNTLDLGTASVQYKNAWFDGTVDTDALTVSANATVGGTLGVTGIITATGGVTGNVTGTVSDVSNHDTDDISEGSTNQYFTTARARSSVSATGSLNYNSGTGVISFTQGDTDTVAEGTTNLYYTDARATAAAQAAITDGLSFVDAGGDGSLTYSAGTITYTGPSAAETRAHFSGGTGVSITNGVVAIGQAVGTTSNVTFNNTVVNGNLTVNGTTTTVNTETLNLADNQIVLNSNETGTPTQNGGIEIERGTAANKTLVWNEADDKWTVGSETFVAGTFEGALTGNADTATTAGTVTTAAQPNITSLGTLSSLTVGDLVLNNSEIYANAELLLNTNTQDIVIDTGQLIDLCYRGTKRGSINLYNANTIGFVAGTTAELYVRESGVNIANGLIVGNSVITPTDNDIWAQADITAGNDLTAGNDIIAEENITAGNDLTAGNDIIMAAGGHDWKFEIDDINGINNSLVISYNGVNKMRLDTAGNLTVVGDVTAYGTV